MFKLSSFVVLVVALICIEASPQISFPNMPVVDPSGMVESVPQPSMGNNTIPGNDMIGSVATMPPTPDTGNMTNGMTAPLTNGMNHIHNSRKNRMNRNNARN